jgi:hypothetical protein
MGVLESSDETGEGSPEFIDVLGGFRKVVVKFDFGFAKLTELVDGELEALLVLVDEAFDFDEVILLEGFQNFFDVVPHLGLELSAAVAESESDIWLPGLFGLDLLGNDDKAGGDDLVLVTQAVADVEVLHVKV